MNSENIKSYFSIITLAFCGLLLHSCLDDDNNDEYYPNALVTVKYASDQTVYLQLDEKTTLLPINLKPNIYGGKQVRALCNFKDVKDPNNGYTKAVYVNWIDSILTKNMVINFGDKNTEIYSNDPLEIIQDWVTVAEDGYLTLRFRTKWGDSQKSHLVNLVAGDETKPYEIEFRQNSHGDLYGYMRDTLVAFKLDKLPDTGGKTVKVKLKWNSFSGDKSIEFDYNSQNIVESASPVLDSRIGSANIE